MLNMTQPASLAEMMRSYERRIEALEMSQRNVRTPVQLSMFQSPNLTLSPPASIYPQGAAAAYTDGTTFREAWIGDFTATGSELNGKAFYWMPPGHTMDMQVRITQIGYGPPSGADIIYSETGIAASSDGGFWNATIPDTAFQGNDIRGVYMRAAIEIRMTSGTERVGVAISTNPYNYPTT